MGVGNLEEQALKRKERLKSLKHKSSGTLPEPAEKKQNVGEEGKLPKPIFRSYQPKDESLKESQLPQALPMEVSEHVQDQLEMANPEPVVDEIDLTTLAPRKPDWDLKRDVSKKLEKLERRTQRAIAELIRDRLQSETGGKDLASAVNANMAASQLEDED